MGSAIFTSVALLLLAESPAAKAMADAPSTADGARGEQPAVADNPEPVPLPAGPATHMTLPIISNDRVHGDVFVDLYPDGQIRYDRKSLIEQLAPLISDQSRPSFVRLLGGGDTLTSEQVALAGVTLRYDPGLLEIHVDRIAPDIAPVRQLGGAPNANQPPITMQPERFSAYLNIVGDFLVEDFRDFDRPAFLLNGAIRTGGMVLEFDGGYDKHLATGSGFYRRAVRLIRDEPDHQRRWSAGDIQIPSLSLIGGTFLGGVGVEKGRQNFIGANPLTSIGGQQILLQRDATVDVVVDGQQVQTMQLAAGPYDLASLRAQYSGRNAQLFITDVTGRRQLTDFDTYASTIDLAQGEEEYSAAIGFLPRAFNLNPSYHGAPAFSGHYRRGISNRLSLGGALQLSRGTQTLGAEIVAAPRAIPGRFDLSGAVSRGDGFGYALRGNYSLAIGGDRGGGQFSIAADYRNARFTTLIDQTGFVQGEALSINANYAQSLNERLILTVGANWFKREGIRVNRSAYADLTYRARTYRLVGGIEYGEGGGQRRNFGIRIGISVPFGRSTRGDASYNSRRDETRAFVSRSESDTVGSWGYNVGVRRSPGSASLDASGAYIGNRFYSRATITSTGSGLDRIDDRQTARLQIGTSIAYAGGALAIGRPINDSFVIASPHEGMEDQQVVIGQSVQSRRYDALSGSLGAALGPRLTSYSRQSILYDLAKGAQGYDIGPGVETVEPLYRSGYRLVVGTDATVSAIGFLNLGAERAGLVSGTVTSSDDDEFGTQPFFTNSAGRFVISGLRPGKTYEARLFDSAGFYRISVPKDSGSLLQLGDVAIAPGVTAKDKRQGEK